MLLLLILSNIPVFSSTIDLNYLDSVELQLFNQKLNRVSIPVRLNRIENSIFGRTFNDSESQRIERLKKFIVINSQNSKNSGQNPKSYDKDTSITDYPAVGQMENTVFRQKFDKENIYLRLDRLESKVFGTTFPNDSLSIRVDKLKTTLIEDDFSFSATNNSEIISSSNISNNQIYTNISALESNILGKVYENDVVTDRLDRLENRIFGAKQVGTVNKRINQLNSVENISVTRGVNQYYYPSGNNNFSLGGMEIWEDEFFNDQSQIPQQKTGFWEIIQNIALPLIFNYLSPSQTYAQNYNPYYDPYYNSNLNTYNNSYSYPHYSNPYHPYGYSVQNIHPHTQSRTLFRNNFGAGVHILP